jgi:hypothetical protein
MKPTHALLAPPFLAAGLFLVALASTPARAGGIGVIGTGGMTTTRAYYYNAEGAQGVDHQTRPQAGFGMEGLLGDRDDKILGVLRLYWLRETPPETPDTQGVSNAIHPDYDALDPRDVGIAQIGIQWGLLGDPNGVQLVLNTLAGTGFLTEDSTEFGLAEAGVGGTWAANESVQVFASVADTLRMRKIVDYGPAAYAGVRYLFD